MLYERQVDGAIACEGHATFVPMSEAEEETWRGKVKDELGHDAECCEFCSLELQHEFFGALGL